MASIRINENPSTLKEIRDAIASLPNNKAAGVDGLPAEFFKDQPAVAADLLYLLITTSWISDQFPEKWNEGIIVEIPKNFDLRDCDNCLLPVIAKIILERLKLHIYATIDAAQAGFRPEASCVDHINTVRIIIE